MTSVHFTEEMGRLMREVIASYEARVSSVEQIIEGTHEMLETFRSQREAMRTQLRETLAQAASLRKRDFEAMMRELLDSQEARERAVKETMRGYLQEQREMATTLKEALTGGEAERIGTVKELLEGIEARREKREREVKSLLADYQREQEEITRALGGFLSNGGSVRAKEFKAALKAIQPRRWSRSDSTPSRQLGREETPNECDPQSPPSFSLLAPSGNAPCVPRAMGRSACAPRVGGIYD